MSEHQHGKEKIQTGQSFKAPFVVAREPSKAVEEAILPHTVALSQLPGFPVYEVYACTYRRSVSCTTDHAYNPATGGMPVALTKITDFRSPAHFEACCFGEPNLQT
jgi:hypothetical protein